MTNSGTEFNPDWISPPGDTITDFIEEQEWTQTEFSKRIGYTPKHVNNLLKGNATIGEDTALRLEKVTGMRADFWLSREAGYRESLARAQDVEQLKSSTVWLTELPINEMASFGWIEKKTTKWQQVEECLRFFGVASRDAWDQQYAKYGAAFRASPKFEKKAGATIAWLRQGERLAANIECQEYSKDKFLLALEEIRALTKKDDPKDFVDELVSICATCGVAVVFTPTPKGCPASGATRWLSQNKALLMLSLRHKTNDHMWFSFFHEAAHILLHEKKMLFLELKGLDSHHESEANEFASNTLIPVDRMHELQTMKYERNTIKIFAQQIGISPSIIVGRLQHDRLIAWTAFNDLKIRYQWESSKA